MRYKKKIINIIVVCLMSCALNAHNKIALKLNEQNNDKVVETDTIIENKKNNMFRTVIFANKVKGSLYFHSMPGRYEPLNASILEIENKKIDMVVSLTSLDEIRKKAPEFANAIEKDSLQFERIEFPIVDFGVPKDTEAFLKLAKHLAKRLQSGENILIHCGAGIGRTGTLAASILVNMDISFHEALDMIKQVGSHPETEEQKELVKWVVDQFEEK
jgi:protein-tyrosine phosphatase